MRDILFRGKRVDNGEWVYGSLVHRTKYYGDHTDKWFILHGGEFDYDYYDAEEVLPETIGQFTGLIDKNGKIIFEGDVVEWDSEEWGCEHREVVEWNYELLDMRKNDWKEWCEVIGNITDNPNILTDKGEG